MVNLLFQIIYGFHFSAAIQNSIHQKVTHSNLNAQILNSIN